jgi:transcriptional regulator with XRE-family HTH domain
MQKLTGSAMSANIAHRLTQVPTGIRSLGEAIRFLRESQGLSLRALAETVRVSAPFLSDLEHNRRSTDKLAEFAAALGVPEAELQRFDGRLSQDLKEWISDNPELVQLLRELRSSGKAPDELRELFFAKDKS